MTRTVTERAHVTDAACQASVPHLPMAGAIYLVQFDFYAHRSCAVRCFRQVDRPGGELELLPCGPGEPPVAPTAGSESTAALSPYGSPIERRPVPARPGPTEPATTTEGSGRDLASPR